MTVTSIRLSKDIEIPLKELAKKLDPLPLDITMALTKGFNVIIEIINCLTKSCPLELENRKSLLLLGCANLFEGKMLLRIYHENL